MGSGAHEIRRLLKLTMMSCCLLMGCQSVPPCAPKVVMSSIESCSIVDVDQTAAQADELGTRCAYHELLRNPERFVSTTTVVDAERSVPMIILGFEKPRHDSKRYSHSIDRSEDGNNQIPTFHRPTETGYPDKAWNEIVDILDDPRPTLMTHVVEMSRQQGEWMNPCVRFSIYATALEKCGDVAEQSAAVPPAASWEALRGVGKRAESIAGRTGVTHLIVFSTGWNTSQAESLRNYASWIDEFDAAVKEKTGPSTFRPLYVGITWESGVEKIPTAASVTFRGNDADELGLTWVNALVNGAIGGIAKKNNIPVIVIGHSFGTRVVGSSVFLSSLLPKEWRTDGFNAAVFVGLQAAFPIRRFVDCEGKEPLWAMNTAPRTRILLTTSKYDAATSTRLAGAYVGGALAMDAKRGMENRPECGMKWLGDARLSKNGVLAAVTQGSALVDAQEVVNCAWPNTGGGAHSDVYDAEIARFVMDEVMSVP